VATTQVQRPELGAKSIAGWRVVFDRLVLIGAIIGVVTCACQVAFAAYGFWVLALNPGDEQAAMSAFEMHATTGMILSYLAIALLIFGLLSRASWKSWAIPLVLAILLWGVQGMLVGLGFSVSPWYGALHAFSGMTIAGGFVWLTVNRSRHPLHSS
jgi:hypothetical protein